MDLATARRAGGWDELDDWGSDDWERWQGDSLYPESRARFGRPDSLDWDLGDEGFDGDQGDADWDALDDDDDLE